MTARRALLALAVAAAPLAQLAGMLPHPALPETPAATLALVAEDPSGWVRMHLLSAAAAALSVVAALALASLVRQRGAGLATAGAVLGVLGGSALAIAFGAEAQLWSLAADPSLDRSGMVQLVALEESSPLLTLLLVGFPLVGLGTLLLMSGLLRSDAVPRWQPALVLVGTVISVAAAPGSAIGPLLFVPAVVGHLALAHSVWRGARRAPVPEAVPSAPMSVTAG